MKNHNISFVYLIIGLLVLGSCSSSKEEQVSPIIEELKNEYAPDKRVAIFDLKFENGILKGETDQLKGLQELKAKLGNEGIKFTDKVRILPSQGLGNQTQALITLSVANLRSEPHHSAELSTQATLGTPLKVLKEKEGWYLVQTPDQYLAWVDEAGIALCDSLKMNNWKESEKVIYTTTTGFAFNDKEESEKISDLVAGNILQLAKISQDHFEIVFPDGRTGFIPKSEGMLFQNWIKGGELTDEKLISTAKTMMGTPYLWGGTSIKGVDCSGFTKTIYYLNGKIIPRDASQQVREGSLVDTLKNWENLEVGDLLFFGQPATETSKEKVVHVGMWIGNQSFIHSRGRVRISSFDPKSPLFDEKELNRYLKTKRYRNSPSKGIQNVQEIGI
ncbi:C40 family peptidase [Echinicola jeungdonensis]|uniref:NlpC/P60 family protein n=1 Tax=Echinicola jeungdonensis TaxID=709343 RepID=A0ABV5J5T9_9BACT|nr:C40 family peptidase [Echinicola jeungdonensis]MDN3670847.1 C40 family peptidase [Echinicola jeungdonensis]